MDLANDWREALLRASDQIDAHLEEHPDAVCVYLAIAFTVEVGDGAVDGVVNTSDPAWITLALLGEAYDKVQDHITHLKTDAGEDA